MPDNSICVESNPITLIFYLLNDLEMTSESLDATSLKKKVEFYLLFVYHLEVVGTEIMDPITEAD